MFHRLKYLLRTGGLAPAQVLCEILSLVIPKSNTTTTSSGHFHNLHFELTEYFSWNGVEAAVIVGGEAPSVSVSEIGRLTRRLKVI